MPHRDDHQRVEVLVYGDVSMLDKIQSRPRNLFLQYHALPARPRSVFTGNEFLRSIICCFDYFLQLVKAPPSPLLLQFWLKCAFHCSDDLVSYHGEEFETVA
jgi:hypothetical protein